jgi:hypothetical protein
VITGIAARLFVLGWALALISSGDRLSCQEPPASGTIDVTVYDLGANPQQFDGRHVRVRALLVFGWEGDNFLSDPVPRNLPSGSPAYLWFYCKHGHEREIYGQLSPYGQPSPKMRSVEARFSGYFHFISTPQRNDMFDPGHLEFEATWISMPEPSRTLADAIGQGDIESVRKILRSGAAVNILDEHRSLPVFESASLGHADILEELLAAGADPNLTLYDGSTPLIAAAFSGNAKSARTLLKHGATANATNAEGETALIMTRDGTMVQLLLDAGADPNLETKKRMTPLIAAAMFGDVLGAEALLKAGADPTVKDDYGNTAESESCDRGDKDHFRVCELVREALQKK